jgi:secondary thiamine-phosphate synthase enzyme
MRTATEYLWFETDQRREFVNITERVRSVVRASGVVDGLVLVSAMHITAAVYVNDDESGLLHDIEAWADRVAPPGDYQHHRTGEANGDAHLKNLLLGHQVVVPVTNGDLDLGPWEQVFYAEFDGQRRKRVVVKVLGE